MRMILEGFLHRKGLYSDTASLRDVVGAAGNAREEAFFFGIGEGLGFFYRERKNQEYPAIGGRIRPAELCRRACQVMGCSLATHTSSSPMRAHAALISQLGQGHPALLQVDEFYLSYLPGDRRHYGARTIVVARIDEAGGVACVADHTRDGLVSLPIAELSAARGSLFRPYPPRNRSFEIGAPSRTEDSASILGAIGRNAMEILNSGTRNSGIGGIYFFASRLRDWKTRYPALQFETICDEARKALEPGGTRGFYRDTYADFLDLARETTGVDALGEAADGYRQVGRMWHQTARMLGEAGCGCVALSEIADHVKTIAAAEHELQVSLMSAANLCCRR